jgi:electron transport complex protein RnfB
MNDMNILVFSVLTLSILGLAIGVLLSVASRIFAVKVDPKIEEIAKVLPGSNCGACGYAGCRAYAEALLSGANPGLCAPGGEDTAKNIAELVGIKGFEVTSKKAAILCGAGKALCELRSQYRGERTCRAETITAGGSSACAYGCLAHGDCVIVCPVNAMSFNGNMPPKIDRNKCIGCGKCVKACPRNIIILEDEGHRTFVLCSSGDKGPFVKKICKVGCIACRICVKDVPGGTMTMEGRIPKVEYAKGEPTEEWIAKCPQRTIVKYK